MPRTIQSDPTRFRQVLMNVAGNAIKFTPTGYVRVRARLSRPAAEPPKLVVEISDTGIGIPADKLETIFDPFTQADSSITRQFGGTGLGLAISRRLAEQLGGGITVESEVGRGTTFICEFGVGSLDDVPLVDRPEREVKAVPAAAAKTAPSLRNYRVLVVDDGDTNRKLVRLLLGRAGRPGRTGGKRPAGGRTGTCRVVRPDPDGHANARSWTATRPRGSSAAAA